ncbi:meckelin-like [Centruroides sculpturatus]|uniref:meckelin-like n=2 Tax=Centruroides sculpturatus TaxID=218467 RepID=UPI000C6E073B|nr:meckelin-like [Centruroides sculpturatus]
MLTFGTAFHISCKMRTQDLWNNANLFFYELLLAANESLEHNLIYPVPVRILNYRNEDNPVNKDPDVSKWQLVRRFFLQDPLSGMESAQVTTQKKKKIAKVFRYASHITLDIKSQKDGKVGTILPPLLTIEYAELTSDDYYKNEPVPTIFAVNYSMDQTKIFEDISIAIGVLSGFSILWSAIQTWGWSRRSGREVIDLAALGKLLIFACGNLSTIFFIVMIACSLNWMILFKKQDVFHLFLPTVEQERKIKIYLIFAFIMKFLQLIHILSVQCTVDIFFIDWERPQVHGLTTKLTSPKSNERSTGEVSAALNTKKDKINGEKNLDSPAVSIWRTYFVAKEWCEIQCLRRVQLGFHLMAVLFFLKGIGFENFAHADPLTNFSSENVHINVPYSFICRFSVGSCTYIILATVQIFLRKLIYERFFQDKLQEFVDLCSVSNISVFVMSARQFGYYIHGHSAHGRADVNMREMHDLLRREEEDLCGHRGLLPNTEQQTFQMFLPALVREQYEHLLLPLNSYSQAADRMQGAGGRLSRADIDKVANIYHMVKKFLSGFIEHAFKDLDYVIKDKLFLESLLDVEFIENTDRGCFYNDNGYSFDNILFRGQEVTIVIFEVMLFTIVDMVAEDYVYSAIVTFIIAKIIKSIRQSVGKRNLVKKALIDERFLG